MANPSKSAKSNKSGSAAKAGKSGRSKYSKAGSAYPAPSIRPVRSAPAGAPNIIFVNVDQLRHDAISALGNPHVYTPNIDALVRAGTTFLCAQSSHPLCSPTRTSWVTGRMPSEHGCISNNIDALKDIPDYAQWLGARGYDCYHAGKWHVQGRAVEDSFNVLYTHYGIGEYSDDACATIAEKFLAERAGDKPFVLNVCLINPHDCCFMARPWAMPALKFGLEKKLAGEMPPIRPAYDPKKPVAGSNIHQWNEQSMRLNNYVYYRQCEMVDDCVGRIFRALRGSRFAANTVFIFSSDHGEMLGEHNRLGKNALYDGSLRVPLIIVAPGRAPENTRNATTLTTGVDITATMLDYAGAEPMPGMTIARSLRPVLEGKTGKIHEYLPAETSVHGVAGPHVSIQHGAYKSIFAMTEGGTSGMELYNTVADPHELKDLARTEAAAPVVAAHRKMLAHYQGRIVHSDNYKQFLRDPKSGPAGRDDDE